jgi:hypothetical protein
VRWKATRAAAIIAADALLGKLLNPAEWTQVNIANEC